ncbi:MAG: MarR family winged helix-turn-helix transcriptional regulator [Candidatus Nanopelagicales bacterium]
MMQAITREAGRGDADVELPEQRVFRALTGLVTQLRRRAEDPDGSARTFLLGHLSRHAPLRMSDLAALACLDQSTVSRHLRGLDEHGLITRSPDPDDGRATLLDLSDAGHEALQRAVRARTDLITAATADWSEKDRTTLADLMTRLAHDLEHTA